ncbi:ZIP metal ion transporter family isoform X1 [Wolffia australiana]
MAEDMAKISAEAVTPSSGNQLVITDRWITTLPVIAKCNIFNGNNMLLWERTIQAALKPRKLAYHLTENCPQETHPNYPRWVVEEEYVFGWMLDSISAEQLVQYSSYGTARTLWEAIHQNHSMKNDRGKIIDLIVQCYTLKQGDMYVLTYSNKLRDIHNELDHCRPPSNDPVARAHKATNRLCQFLQGLRPEFEMVRSQLYNREEEPTFDEAVSKVMQEESRLNSTKGAIENTSYVAKAQNQQKHDSGKLSKEDIVCNYCKKKGHMKDKCWKLHGKPPHIARAHMLQAGDGSGNPNSQRCTPSLQDFQKMMQELQSIKSFINSGAVIGSASLVNSGMKEIFHNIALLAKGPSIAWILDSGATDHMSFRKEFFIT